MEKLKENLIDALDEMDFIVVVPTSGINEIYEHFEAANKCLYMTREEEGVALASGLSLGGKKVLMLIQQSGVGNLLNALFTLADPYVIEFPIIVLIRGEKDENPIHWLSSRKTIAILKELQAKEIDWNSNSCLQDFRDAVLARTRWIISYYR